MYELTQQKKAKTRAGPIMNWVNGIELNVTESNAQDKIITALYGLVASELSIPAHPTSCCWTTARCQSPYFIFALFALLTSLLVKYLHSHPLYTFATLLSSSA